MVSGMLRIPASARTTETCPGAASFQSFRPEFRPRFQDDQPGTSPKSGLAGLSLSASPQSGPGTASRESPGARLGDEICQQVGVLIHDEWRPVSTEDSVPGSRPAITAISA